MESIDSKHSTGEASEREVKKHVVKIVVLGDVNVGKTNIIRRVFDYEFKEMEATIGVEFGFVDVKDIDKDDSSVILSVQIWDTSGAEKYRAITASHIRNADGAFLVYDITNENSFNMLPFWLESIKKSTNDDIVLYLLGNKCDLKDGEDDPVYTLLDVRAKEFAKIYNRDGFKLVSAKDNKNIKETFDEFYKTVYSRQKENLIQRSEIKKQILSSKRKETPKACC